MGESIYLCKLSLEGRDLLMEMCTNAIRDEQDRLLCDPEEIAMYQMALDELRAGVEEVR